MFTKLSSDRQNDTKKKISKIILLVFLFSSSIIFAQTPPPPFGDDVNDEALPIDSDILVLLGLGVCLGFLLLKKNEKIKITTKTQK